ncbi:uncharacterized protein DUF3156 [Xenorhabdus cabanillasii]|uniref:Uncharacterized protein DUF3156 n=1 Tax=Xenorhabdus cabanillasii TaxID=351673 RepID=A0A3D9UKF0_9GAMM|nr:DUF3156 family protein [Xenorhabdus cabanillasii]REF28903.1 uncharacterized protein DUF3156 [Xenorhabdus cabanillasii]
MFTKNSQSTVFQGTYQAGLTLNRLERDLQPYHCERTGPDELLIKPEGQLTICINERVKILFMAFIVYTRFSVSGTINQPLNAEIQVKTRGSLRKKQIRFFSKQKDGCKLIEQLEQYPVIRQSLEELDFRSCSLQIKEGIWSSSYITKEVFQINKTKWLHLSNKSNA